MITGVLLVVVFLVVPVAVWRQSVRSEKGLSVGLGCVLVGTWIVTLSVVGWAIYINLSGATWFTP